ncbi:MAG: hypothetical protein LBH90_04740 [Tannerella sp.]|nr:hypothetical protein [Tannerella sp.]
MQQSENLTSSEVLSIEWHYEFPELLNMTEDTVSYIASRSWMKSVSAGIFLHKSRNQHRMQICQMKEDFDPEQVNLEDYTPKN